MRLASTLVFLFLSCAAVKAQVANGVIYKCVDTHGKLAYQSKPCGTGKRQLAVVPYVIPSYRPDLARKVEADRQALEQRRQQSGTVYNVFNNGPAPVQQSKVQRCRNAKAHRQQTLDRVGLKRTFDLLRRLDEQVYQACKDAPGA